MAVYPCDYDRRRYRAAQQSIYWTEVSNHLVVTRKIRLCPEHFDFVHQAIQQQMAEVDQPVEVSGQCEQCDDPSLFMVSARVYPAHKTDEQYVTDLCAAHASALGNDLHVYNASPLGDR